MKIDLPITNIRLWKKENDRYIIHDGHNREFLWLWDSQIETVDEKTLHYKRKAMEIEGISIGFNGNPFNFKKYGNTFTKVYSYKEE